MPLPLDRWQVSLDQMESALAAATKSLDRADERWEMAAAPSAGEGEAPVALERLDARLQEWGAKLQASEALAAEVGKELAERAAALERWRGLFARWEELVKRGGNPSPAS